MKNKFLMLTVICMFCITLSTVYYISQTKAKTAVFASELEQLETTIKENERKIEELHSDIEYQSSKEFIEKTAREKLGFVMSDEIVFIEN